MPDIFTDDRSGRIGRDDTRITGLGAGLGAGLSVVPLLCPGAAAFHRPEFIASWVDNHPLLASETRLIAAWGSSDTVKNCTTAKYLTWGVVSSDPWTFTVYGSFDAGFASYSVLATLTDATGGIYLTPYALTGAAAKNGLLILTCPFVRIQVTDLSLGNHTATDIWARAWSEKT